MQPLTDLMSRMCVSVALVRYSSMSLDVLTLCDRGREVKQNPFLPPVFTLSLSDTFQRVSERSEWEKERRERAHSNER